MSIYKELEQSRESDRKRFPDEAFNRWLDEGISDSGHTVWDTIDNIYDAWAAWDSRPHYGKPEQAEKQEPVAWMWENVTVTTDPDRADGTWTPLYTAPPRKPWVSLSDEELFDAMDSYSDLENARKIEQLLKEKNHAHT